MADAYVYAPVNGAIWSMDGTSNCGGGTPCSHCRFNGAAGNPMGSPIDVGGGSAGADLYFYTNGAVGSVYTQLDDFSSSTCLSPLGQVVVVKLFAGVNASGTFIGAVAYQHVTDRVAAGSIFNGPGPNPNALWGIRVGAMAASCGNGCCYNGVHSHMERDGGNTNSFYCNQQVSGGAGGTWIYHWGF